MCNVGSKVGYVAKLEADAPSETELERRQRPFSEGGAQLLRDLGGAALS